MSVYRPKNSPYYQYDFQFKGNRFYGSTKATTKREAVVIEAAIREKVRRGEFFEEDAQMSLDVAANCYFDEVGQHKATADDIEDQLANLIRIIGGTTLLSVLGNGEIAKFVARRRGEKARRGHRLKDGTFISVETNRLVAPATVNRETELLKRVIRRADNVWKAAVTKIEWSLHELPEPDGRARILTPYEEQRLLDEAAPHLKAPIQFSLMTGVRLDNAMTLDWSQIDLHSREIRFAVKSKKPGGKVLIVPIAEDLLVLLANLGPREKGRVFCRKGRPIKSWRTAWQGALRRAGIDDFRWHDLRHTVGTRLVQNGVDVTAVKEILGHADISTTMRYVHHKTDDKRRALETLSRNNPELVEASVDKPLKNKA